jgi:TonB family protein
MPKPEVPNEKPRMNPVVAPPVNPIGPIVVAPIAPIDPGIIIGDPIDPLPQGWGNQKPIDPGTIWDPFLLEEFPTYEEFKPIKDQEERRGKTDIAIINKFKSKATYPKLAQQLNIEGTVYVSFVVNKEGKITDVKIARSVHESLDAEAIKAVQTLPKMIPGKQNDKEVNVKYTIPVKFELR